MKLWCLLRSLRLHVCTRGSPKEPGGTVRHVLGIESHDFMSKNDEDTDEYHENNVNKNVWMISTIMMNMDGQL